MNSMCLGGETNILGLSQLFKVLGLVSKDGDSPRWAQMFYS